VNAPKTERGNRVVALPTICIEALRRRRQAQRLERVAAGPRWQDTGFVFTAEIGTPIDPDNLHKAWQKFAAKAGLGKLQLHALRHSAATVALA
jgi:integrase